MNAWLNNTLTNLKLTFRDRQSIFWSYLFPLFFLFLFSSIFAHGQAQLVSAMLPGLLCISAMSAGFFGLSIGLVTDRERGILRRYRLAPISPLTMITSELAANLVVVLSTLALQLILAKLIYKIEIVGNLFSFFLMLLVGALAFQGIGFIIASVADNAKTAQLMTNLLFFPLMFLGGAALPRQMLPPAVQKISELLPSRYFVDGLSSIVNDGAGLSDNIKNLTVLLATFVFALIIAARLFRWESRESLSPAKKAFAAAVVLIFVVAALLKV